MELDKDLLSIQNTRDLARSAVKAQKEFSSFNQEKVDIIVQKMAEAGFREARSLAKLAVEDTGMGKYEDKIIKNQFATRDIWNSIKNMKTVGLIEIDRRKKLFRFAEPMGVVGAIIPTTNPTSTVMYNIIISVKCRNGVVVSPHPNAGKCTKAAVDLLADVAVRNGAPRGLISCIGVPTIKAAEELMHHPSIAVILATGGPGIVKAAYSSGKPAYGVGPGNVPVYIHKSADINKAVKDVILSKTFDYGVICSSEQAVLADKIVYKKVKLALLKHGAHICSSEEAARLQKFMVDENRKLNMKVVGQSPQQIAQWAGFTVDDNIRALVVEAGNSRAEHPLAIEKLSPVLVLFSVNGPEEGISLSKDILMNGGIGHTAGIHCKDEDLVMRWAQSLPVGRLVVNSPTVHGSVGYSTEIQPALTLGSGTWSGSISTDNISPINLLNYKTMVYETRPVNTSDMSFRFSQEGFEKRGDYSRFDAAPIKIGATEAKGRVYGTTKLRDEEIDKIIKDFSARK